AARGEEGIWMRCAWRAVGFRERITPPRLSHPGRGGAVRGIIVDGCVIRAARRAGLASQTGACGLGVAARLPVRPGKACLLVLAGVQAADGAGFGLRPADAECLP